MNIFEEYELYKEFTDLYYFLEDASTLTLEEEQNMVSKECSEFEELYYKYKCFYFMAQVCPVDERHSFFCDLAIKELQGPVAVDLREAIEVAK